MHGRSAMQNSVRIRSGYNLDIGFQVQVVSHPICAIGHAFRIADL